MNTKRMMKIEYGGEEGTDDDDDIVSIYSKAEVPQATAEHLFNRVMPSNGIVGNYVSIILCYRKAWKTELNHRHHAKVALRSLFNRVEQQCKNVLESHGEQWAFSTTDYLDQFRCDPRDFRGRVRGGLVDDYGGRLIVGLNENDPDSPRDFGGRVREYWTSRHSSSDTMVELQK
jgi:hypothetical protein